MGRWPTRRLPRRFRLEVFRGGFPVLAYTRIAFPPFWRDILRSSAFFPPVIPFLVLLDYLDVSFLLLVLGLVGFLRFAFLGRRRAEPTLGLGGRISVVWAVERFQVVG